MKKKQGRLTKLVKSKSYKSINLNSAQLVKHLLGLKEKFGKNKFRLLYLWYDTPGYEGVNHRSEIQEFMDATMADNIHFHALSYQELIIRLCNQYRSNHEKYIKYISGRYL